LNLRLTSPDGLALTAKLTMENGRQVSNVREITIRVLPEGFITGTMVVESPDREWASAKYFEVTSLDVSLCSSEANSELVSLCSSEANSELSA
jgi:hypothetical protein